MDSREIKFRAVLNEEAKTLKEYDSEIRYFTLEDLMRGRIVFSFPEHWIFCEWTGLKDKNGKEIYEGDIVAGYGVSLPVEYRGFGFSPFTFLMKKDEFFRPSKCEIIGNIYENKDLLK